MRMSNHVLDFGYDRTITSTYMQHRYNLLKVPDPFCGLGAGGGVTGAGGGVDGLACWKKLNAGAAFFFTSGFFSSTTGAGSGAGLALLEPKKSLRASGRCALPQ